MPKIQIDTEAIKSLDASTQQKILDIEREIEEVGFKYEFTDIKNKLQAIHVAISEEGKIFTNEPGIAHRLIVIGSVIKRR